MPCSIHAGDSVVTDSLPTIRGLADENASTSRLANAQLGILVPAVGDVCPNVGLLLHAHACATSLRKKCRGVGAPTSACTRDGRVSRVFTYGVRWQACRRRVVRRRRRGCDDRESGVVAAPKSRIVQPILDGVWQSTFYGPAHFPTTHARGAFVGDAARETFVVEETSDDSDPAQLTFNFDVVLMVNVSFLRRSHASPRSCRGSPLACGPTHVPPSLLRYRDLRCLHNVVASAAA